MKEVILTREGYEKLKQEIELLSTEKRREVADRIRVAREFGDISENAEYDDAKNEQAMLEHKIAQLEDRLSEIYANRPDRVLFVKASPDVLYEVVIAAMDAARGAGVAVLGAVL